ncbi:toprim domain-containing protein [Acerihabitans sp. TG2]|uniref:toprim domain-containing protein n=1 Tax=Acerihabitans sp. TG2 TaxID=3096008 RepID=UPI002B23C7D4|nr:toprim domain-containing protein [Acerihabitans sp. TG2]MEA9392180.1 toprim domain-containing protein [Acerihabitans sp. TG2]
MANRLFIIEAPGKESILNRILYQVYKQRCEVISTVGHICANPPNLGTEWITNSLTEHSYQVRPERRRIVENLAVAARIADEIYLATDDDHEGDVIARDVVKKALDGVDINKLFRVRLRAMTIDEVRRAISEREPFSPDANKGDARRVLDRLIGTLSNRQGAIGRVQGSILIELALQTPVTGLAVLKIPSSDGGSAFTGILPVFAGESFDFDEINELCNGLQLSPGASLDTSVSTTWNHTDILLNCSLRTGQSPVSLADAMQRLYERGQMTYPRSSQRTVSCNSVNRTQLIARMQGVNFRPELVRNVRRPDAVGHEAPTILESDVPINRQVNDLSDAETAVKLLVARNQVESGLPCKMTFANSESLSQLPEILKNIQWHRKDIQGLCLWNENNPPHFKQWTQQQSLLHFMQQTHLGRPSTVIVHIEKFLSRCLINTDFSLTDKGKIWLSNHKEIFHNKNISNIIEKYFEVNNQSPEVMVRALLEICQLDVSNSVDLTGPERHEIQEDTDDEYTTNLN